MTAQVKWSEDSNNPYDCSDAWLYSPENGDPVICLDLSWKDDNGVSMEIEGELDFDALISHMCEVSLSTEKAKWAAIFSRAAARLADSSREDDF